MLPNTPPTVGSRIFDNTPLKTVYVSDEYSKALYEVEEPWKYYDIIALTTGIDDLQIEKDIPRIVGYFNLDGKKIYAKHCGHVIVRYSDGSTRKVIVK